MNSDAKIGLMLGLVFIIIISFIINGLPNLFKGDGEDESVVTAIIDVPDYTGIGDTTEEAVQTIRLMETVVTPRELAAEQTMDEQVRFEQNFGAGEELAAAERLSENKRDRRDRPKQKKYVVETGDNLAVIAKKFYGTDHGNRHLVIERLFEVNRKTLKSPDKLMVGDKLEIPPLALLYGGQRSDNIEGSGLFERVKTVAGDGVSALKTAVGLDEPREYIVKSDDTLWGIAENFLGDGSRYEDIVSLNKSVISDYNQLDIGTVLKVPAK